MRGIGRRGLLGEAVDKPEGVFLREAVACAVKRPCACDDFSEVGVLGIASQLMVGSFAGGDADRGGAWSAVREPDGEVGAGDLSDGVEDLAVAVALAVAAVVAVRSGLVVLFPGWNAS